MQTYQRLPIHIAKGKGVWVWDQKGNKYLDAVAGIATCTLGHSDRKIRKALTRQLKKIQHVSNLYHIPEQEELAQWLIAKSCASSVFFCNSGAEANEAAIKLARKYSKKRGIDNPIILSAKRSFHGRTLATLSATGQEKYQEGFSPLVQGFNFFTYNDSNSFQELHSKIIGSGSEIAAVLIEPIQGEGGLHPGEKQFFKLIRDICTKHKILLIFDEVQTGMGRTGKLWGYENLDIEPDAFTIAKGLGSGHAIGALLAKENANIFDIGDHASTFGGNPFACRAALTVAQEIECRDLLENVVHRGNQLKEGLLKIIDKNPIHLQETRGIGLMQGLVIREDSHLKAKGIIDEAIQQGLLIISAGENVIRFVPPLIITKKEINILLNKLNRTFSSLL
ncbi:MULTISPECIES: aspartate aminotransferase family protein [Prochlorococcus]|uniref:aspartate aminotransferase family protein n=1 Tax=Prochlorococcus TaxID=1218 RepID=UPI0005337B6F|nr:MULTISPECIES: aspartate aminotransferase family protein [Prochlorococcus]KGG11983.1 Acetylornithine aminotransferase [Prochlorococcus sp. MIT 0601]